MVDLTREAEAAPLPPGNAVAGEFRDRILLASLSFSHARARSLSAGSSGGGGGGGEVQPRERAPRQIAVPSYRIVPCRAVPFRGR